MPGTALADRGLPTPRTVEDALDAARAMVERSPLTALRHARSAAARAMNDRDACWAGAYEVRALGYLGLHRDALDLALPLASRFRSLRDRSGVAFVLTDTSGLLSLTEDFAGAHQAVEEGLANARAADDRELEFELLHNRAGITLLAGDTDGAERAILLAREAADRAGGGEDYCLRTLAEIRFERLGNRPWGSDRDRLLEEAAAHARAATRASADKRYRNVESMRLETEALVWADDGQAALEWGAQTLHLSQGEGGEAAVLGQIAYALGLTASGMRGSALATIREAVERAAPGSYAWRDARRVEGRIREGVYGSR